MSDRIVTGRPAHLLSGEVHAEVYARYGVDELSDAAALTVAAWWQSPGGAGRAFAELASTGAVDVHDLSRAIAEVYGEAGPHDRRALDMLGTWALNHDSRELADD